MGFVRSDPVKLMLRLLGTDVEVEWIPRGSHNRRMVRGRVVTVDVPGRAMTLHRFFAGSYEPNPGDRLTIPVSEVLAIRPF